MDEKSKVMKQMVDSAATVDNSIFTKDKAPPIGIMPRKLHDDSRERELILAMARYLNHGQKIPGQWIEELRYLNERL